MKAVFAALALLVVAGTASADVVVPASEVTITGTEATKIANMMITGADRSGTYAQGKAKVSCVRKRSEANFTCVVQVVRQ